MKKEWEAGDKFMFKGFEWVVLNPDPIEKGGVLAMMTSTWNGEEYPFDENGCNNWEKSSLKKKLEEELLPLLGEKNLLEHMVDLEADNGSLEYGVDWGKVFILTCREYRRYREDIPLLPEWMWTCTPWITAGNTVRLVLLDGSLGNGSANDAFGVAPACVFIKESLIAQTGADERVLECEKRIQELEDFLEEVEGLLDYMDISREAEELTRLTGVYEKSVLRSYAERAEKIRTKSKELRGE